MKDETKRERAEAKAARAELLERFGSNLKKLLDKFSEAAVELVGADDSKILKKELKAVGQKHLRSLSTRIKKLSAAARIEELVCQNPSASVETITRKIAGEGYRVSAKAIRRRYENTQSILEKLAGMDRLKPVEIEEAA